MRLIGFVLAACLGLAVLSLAAKVVALALTGAALWYGVTRPVQTLGCLTMFLITGLASQFPIASMAMVGCLLIARLLTKMRNSEKVS